MFALINSTNIKQNIMRHQRNQLKFYSSVFAIVLFAFCFSSFAQDENVGAKAGFAEIVITPENTEGGAGYSGFLAYRNIRLKGWLQL